LFRPEQEKKLVNQTIEGDLKITLLDYEISLFYPIGGG
jgi:hypothetical protein